MTFPIVRLEPINFVVIPRCDLYRYVIVLLYHFKTSITQKRAFTMPHSKISKTIFGKIIKRVILILTAG